MSAKSPTKRNRKTTEDVDLMRPPRAGQSPKVYAAFLLDLSAFDGLYDRKTGRVAWLQGKALIAARKQITERGGWKRFCQKVGMSESTAKQRRKVATLVTEKESHTLGYSEMLARVYPSYKSEMRKDADADWAEKPKRGKGKTRTGKGKVVGGRLKIVPNDPMPADDMGQDLTAVLTTLQEIETTKRPADIDANKIQTLKGSLVKIGNEIERVRIAVDKWDGQLNRRVSA